MALRLLCSLRLILTNLAKKGCFLVARMFFLLFLELRWRLTGIHRQIIQNKREENFSRCAQVLRIVAWSKFCFVQPVDMSDFIYVHQDFLHPQYVLQNDNVFLFFIDHTNEYAVFAEGEEGQLLWKSDFSPFVMHALVKRSKKLIRMPLLAFYKLAEGLSDPGGKLVVVSNTTRCGSTVIAQMFECTGRSVVYSEPHVLMDIAVMYRREGMTEKVARMTRYTVRMLCKHLETMPDPVAYLLKPTGPAALCMAPINAVFPQAIMFYVYRDITKVSLSLYKVSFISPTVRLGYLTSRVSARLQQRNFEMAGFPPPTDYFRVKDDFSAGVIQAMVCTSVYTQLRMRNDGVFAVRFDDVLEDPALATRAIFSVCGLPAELADEGVKAFSRDSQRNSPVSQQALAAVPDLCVSVEDRTRGSAIAVHFGYPPLDQPCFLEGTLDLAAVLHEG